MMQNKIQKILALSLLLSLSAACGEGDNTLPPVGAGGENPGENPAEETPKPVTVHCGSGEISLKSPVNTWAAEAWRKHIPDITYISDGSSEPYDDCAKAQKLREVGYVLLSPGLDWPNTQAKFPLPELTGVLADDSCETEITTANVTLAAQRACSAAMCLSQHLSGLLEAQRECEIPDKCGIYPLEKENNSYICESREK